MNFLKGERSFFEKLRTKSKGSSSIKPISTLAFLRMEVLCPQEMVAVKNPAISMSSFLVNRWGIEIGSENIKPGLL